ncbi:MFS transporter [Cellulomonas oligotrophica]|uniref:MFS transporter n=1 Tax=Cellulomonas oligotrophica TaxID=931536 RepID=A0A7Y9K009_9CELL|nr:MFS transporter [Cellulomonas oligotrophica]NYD86825.1 putative MFS family arabinose efflux permease [Cellulomonas oligotrophica]GIG32389.1 MFS transporter [Cellulomonas oligotrophica]
MTDASTTTTTPGVATVRARVAVGASYAAQGFGYATVVTALPGLKLRTGIDDATISLVLLMGALLAAAGSVLAERIATRRASRLALVAGLLAQAVGLGLVTTATSVPPLVAAFTVFSLGLGMVDAAGNMQGVALQRAVGRSIMSTLFACLTAAAIVAALTQSGLTRLGTERGAITALLVAAAVAAGVALAARTSLLTTAQTPPVAAAAATSDAAEPGAAPTAAPAAAPLPRAGIWLFGAMVAIAFVADSAVSSWSTVYLHDTLVAPGAVAPLGYAAYQAAVLVTRLLGDPLVRRVGRAAVVAACASVGVVGLLLVALVPSPTVAVIGFALTGVGTGSLVPLAFSAAGELAPERLDQVVARINLFNYVGATLGAVVLGLLSETTGLGPAFLVPALLMVPAVVAAPRFGGVPGPLGRRGRAAAAAEDAAPPSTPSVAPHVDPPAGP